MNASVMKVRGFRTPPHKSTAEQQPVFYRAQPLIAVPKPPFITDPEDSCSAEFQRDCLTWWLMTTKSVDELNSFLNKQKPKAVKALKPHLTKCKAWIWLCRMDDSEIRGALNHVIETDDEPLRRFLNQLKPLFSQRGK